MSKETLVALMLVLVMAFIFFSERGGLKAQLEHIWCGKEGCDDEETIQEVDR